MIRHSAANRSPTRVLRAALFKVHAWLGLVFSLLFAAVFLNGTILVFGNEIDQAIYPQMRATPQAGGQVGFGTIYDAARDAYPDYDIVSISRDPDGQRADLLVSKTPDGEEHHLWVDPSSGTVNGITPLMTPRHLLLEVHSHFLVDTRNGHLLATSLSLVLSVSIVTGLVTYRRFWTGLFRRPALRAGGRARWSSLHRLLAVWLLPFLTVIALTGAYYMLGGPLGLVGRLPAPERAVERSALLPQGFDGGQLDRAVAIARTTYPDLEVERVELPTWRGGGIVVGGQGTALLVGPSGNAVTVDPVTFEVLGQHRGEELSAARRVTEMVDPLHTGAWGGRFIQILWFVFGVMATTMALTGAVLCNRGLRRAPAGALPNRTEGRAPRWSASLPGLRWLSLIVVAVIVLVSALMMAFDAGKDGPTRSAQGPAALSIGAAAGLLQASDEDRAT